MEKRIKAKIENIKNKPGVYWFYDAKGKLLYIGKAIDLNKRVSQYFARPQDERISQMVNKIADIKIIETDTNIEALILEANLINKHKPPYNVLLKDDKTFGGIFISDNKFPLVYPARITDQLPKGEWFGPYVSARELKIALKVLRHIFRWCDKPPQEAKLLINNYKLRINRSCFYHHINLCSGACVGAVTKQQYNRQIKHLKMFLRGEKNKLLKTIEKEMAGESKKQNYEQAQKFKIELDGLTHIHESAFVVTGDSPITPYFAKASQGKKSKSNLKIECYDVANIGNDSIVGGMVVFIGGQSDNQQYRQFKIKSLKIQNDVGAMAEMVERRLKHNEWKYPGLMLIDGGIGQVNAVRQILHQRNIIIPVVGIAKGAKRNKNELVGDVAFITSQKIPLKTLINARDEAHRFARRYFFGLRKSKQIDSN